MIALPPTQLTGLPASHLTNYLLDPAVTQNDGVMLRRAIRYWECQGAPPPPALAVISTESAAKLGAGFGVCELATMDPDGRIEIQIRIRRDALAFTKRRRLGVPTNYWVVWHELAHALDQELVLPSRPPARTDVVARRGRFSATSAWRDLYARYRAGQLRSLTGYAAYSRIEFFAEAIVAYVARPDSFQRRSPEIATLARSALAAGAAALSA
ncbi:MAG: zinc-dependent peptidase [Chloroflexi bacterium]|nr:zinc-dependent peptidase [Chloroflexota bacterium]